MRDMMEVIQGQIQDLAKRLTDVAQQPRSEYTGGIASRTVAQLPTTGQSGQLYFASNGRKSGEGVGAGTGVPVYWNPATSQWLRFEDNSPVQA